MDGWTDRRRTIWGDNTSAELKLKAERRRRRRRRRRRSSLGYICCCLSCVTLKNWQRLNWIFDCCYMILFRQRCNGYKYIQCTAWLLTNKGYYMNSNLIYIGFIWNPSEIRVGNISNINQLRAVGPWLARALTHQLWNNFHILQYIFSAASASIVLLLFLYMFV